MMSFKNLNRAYTEHPEFCLEILQKILTQEYLKEKDYLSTSNLKTKLIASIILHWAYKSFHLI